MPAKELSHAELFEAARSALGAAGHWSAKPEDISKIRDMNDEQLRLLASYWSQRPRPADPVLPNGKAMSANGAG